MVTVASYYYTYIGLCHKKTLLIEIYGVAPSLTSPYYYRKIVSFWPSPPLFYV